MALKRAISVSELLGRTFKVMKFTGLWLATFGSPELSGVWIFWGESGNGKTRLILQLAKYLTNFGKVLYNTLEEGARLSMQTAVRESNMNGLKGKFKILNRESISDLKQRLRRRKSARIIIIDSIQYADLNKRAYKQLKEEFPEKLFIFISHAEGKSPEGRTAKFVRYDADIKGRVEGYKLFVTSRFGGGADYIIWNKGAKEYWGF